MSAAPTEAPIAQLPKAELHLHLEGSLRPATVAELAARHGEKVAPQEVEERYLYTEFHGFLEAYKWVTSFLRTPADYALATERLAGELLAQNVVYAEVTLSAGVMLWRNQDADANLLAIHEAGMAAQKLGLRMQWIPDVTRQFGPEAAMAVARHAARCRSLGVVAFGMGGDELSIPAEQFRAAFDYAASEGLHRVSHAGEIGGPEEVRAAVELLGAERIGHGIAAMHDTALMQFLTGRRIPLEICPTSNLCTGALARQLNQAEARFEEHSLPRILREGVPVTLSTDDPAMFRTTLNEEYAVARRMGLSPREIAHLARASFDFAFLSRADKESLLARFQQGLREHGLV